MTTQRHGNLPGAWPMARVLAVLGNACARAQSSGRPSPVAVRVLERLEREGNV